MSIDHFVSVRAIRELLSKVLPDRKFIDKYMINSMMVWQHSYGMSTFIYSSAIFIYFYIMTVDDGISISIYFPGILIFILSLLIVIC